MFEQFISEYGTQILYLIFTAIAGYIGIMVKNLYQRYINDQIKKDVVKTVVQGVQQLYKDLRAEEKLEKATEAVSEMLLEKGIAISSFEMRMLIEAAVAEFKDVFNKTNTPTDTPTITEASTESEVV